MIREDQTNQIKDLIQVSETAVVVLTPEPTKDQVASATALFLSLQALGKQVSFVIPKKPDRTSDIETLSGLDQLQTELGNQDLTVSFPYLAEKVDKVSYHIDESSQKFYLVIKPKKGVAPLDTAAIEYAYTGAATQLIFLIGVHSFESLEQLYFGYEALYTSVPVITFHTFEPRIGSIKVDASGTSSLSESMSQFLFMIGAPPDADAATNLLLAIEETTDNFKSLVTTAETFEIVAYLLRQGARRNKRQSVASSLPAKKSPEVMVVTQRSVSKKPKSKVGTLEYQPSNFSPSSGG